MGLGRTHVAAYSDTGSAAVSGILFLQTNLYLVIFVPKIRYKGNQNMDSCKVIAIQIEALSKVLSK